MKRQLLLLTLFALCQMVTAQTFTLEEGDCCTSIMVGKKASVDGSVMTSHTCDSWYRTWVNIVPAADYPNDTVMSIYKGRMHTEFAKDETGVKEWDRFLKPSTLTNSSTRLIRA